MSKKQRAYCSRVSRLVSELVSKPLVHRLVSMPMARRLVSSPLIFDLALVSAIILAFALYQETPPGTWAHIRRILGRW